MSFGFNRPKLNTCVMSFANKVVIVTGSSAGIGAATAIQFAKEGAKVMIVGRNESKLKEVASKCKKLNSDYHVVKADITKENEAKLVIEETIKKYGSIDILINNAGIIREGCLLNGKMLEIYDELMNTNLKAVIVLTTLAGPHLIKTKGNIVNVSSVAGSRVKHPSFTAYSVSKAALNMLTVGTALEMAPHGVRVNIVSPGPTKTDIMVAAGLGGKMEDMEKHTALGRISDPEEVAELILFLASDKAKGITGSDYVCDNGALVG